MGSLDKSLWQIHWSYKETLLIMKDRINPDNDSFDPSEEYFKKKGDTYENETEEYFPQETSTPPHY